MIWGMATVYGVALVVGLVFNAKTYLEWLRLIEEDPETGEH